MFKKVLVANRGEIAVRIVRTCRDLGIPTVALHDHSDRESLHVRLADECVRLDSPLGYLDSSGIIKIAKQKGAEAIHPGYGFLSERSDFIAACEENGVAFVGPPSRVVKLTNDRTGLLKTVEDAGIQVPPYSPASFYVEDHELIKAAAVKIGFPLVVRSCQGGRGHSARDVHNIHELQKAVAEVAAEAFLLFGDRSVYLEKTIPDARLIVVQLLADKYGNMVHTGTRDGTPLRRGVKLVVESPAPFLSAEQEETICQDALKIGRMLNFCNAGTVEFLLDAAGRHYFTEMKARIQVEHPTTEMITGLDIIRKQLEIAAGEKLSLTQSDIRINGCAMLCRINAEDPLRDYMPCPGRLRHFRMPGGPNVRVDGYGYSGCDVPVHYEPLLAKITVWGEDRKECISRMRRALNDTAIVGVRTNIVLHKTVIESKEFAEGTLTTQSLDNQCFLSSMPGPDLKELAVAAALSFVLRNRTLRPVVPDSLREGWHRSARQLL